MSGDANNIPDFLNQSDIDKMLAEATQDERAPIFRADGTPFANPETKVETFDFRTPIFLAEAELRRLRLIHQEFIRTLSARFSAFLRADFNFKMSKLTTLPYDKFAETISNPSHLTLFKVDPLPGIAVLEIQPRLAMNMANRMLGGKGGSGGEHDRYLTEIEIALLEEVVAMIMSEWCTQWREESGLNPKMLGHETNARFLQICSKDTVMLALAMEVQGETAETLQIGVPYQMIEPIVKKMQNARQREVESVNTRHQGSWRTSYDNISIPVVADWPVATMSLADVARLRAGDFIQLPTTVIEQTRVRLASTAQFVGKAGRENGRVAVQLNSRVAPTPSSHPAQ